MALFLSMLTCSGCRRRELLEPGRRGRLHVAERLGVLRDPKPGRWWRSSECHMRWYLTAPARSV